MLKELLFRPTHIKRVIFFLFFDILISIFTIYLSFLLRFNFNIPSDFLSSMYIMMDVLIPIKIFIFFIFKIYFIAWRFFGLYEYRRIVFAHLVSYILFTTIFFMFGNYFYPFPRSVIVIDLFLSLFFIGFMRISKRLYIERGELTSHKKSLIIGANDRTTQVIKSAFSKDIPYYPVAIISNDKRLIGTYFSNLKVYSRNNLENIIDKLDIKSVIITEKLSQKELDELFTRLNSIGINDIKIAQVLQDRAKLLDISIEDLLARKPQDLDKKAIAKFIDNKVVLITGAGGSIGSELARQVKSFGAKKIILLDHSEFNLYSITEELKDFNIVSIMQNVQNRDLLENTFYKYKPDIVFHAAAYKHVPLCEENIYEAILNNIIGTKNVIDLSIKYNVEKFVLISTDKAVRPTNVMGATKRVTELYAQNVDSKNTEIVAVRFGNVLGSSGSVIPKFKEQIKKGGPITVTHPEITRYFMLIPEACQLVLQAGAIGNGGEIFILDMGEPIKIVDLAKRMCELSGKKNIEIKFTGLRPGEKLYEELLINESDAKTEYESILVAKSTKYEIKKLNKDIQELLNSNDLITKLKEIVPEFNHNTNQNNSIKPL